MELEELNMPKNTHSKAADTPESAPKSHHMGADHHQGDDTAHGESSKARGNSEQALMHSKDAHEQKKPKSGKKA
jgi:hypothetical protein